MAVTMFIPTVLPQARTQRSQARTRSCAPQAPNDPSGLRSESEVRRNQAPKPMRRRARRREVDDPLDWDKLPGVPIVRRSGSPESGEDYWMSMDASAEANAQEGETTRKKKPIDDRLRERLKQEVVSPYTQNWILWAGVIVAVLVGLVAIFGGEEMIPIIAVPDL